MATDIISIADTKQARRSTLARWLLALGWILLPFSYFRWLPNLGLTRPLSALFFLIGIALLLIQYFRYERPHGQQARSLQAWHRWLEAIPGWKLWRWWLVLIAMGAISAAFTPLYGNFFQAINRLFGYSVILLFLLSACYSLHLFGIHTIAKWTAYGYVPLVPYVVIEALGLLKVQWAVNIILWVRSILVVDYPYVNRSSLLSTEPSFVGFQVLLLLALFPFIQNKLLKWLMAFIMVVSGLLSLSGTTYEAVLFFFAVLVFLTLTRKAKWITIAAVVGGVIILLLVYTASPKIRQTTDQVQTQLMSYERIKGAVFSQKIRNSYVQNLIYAIVETRGLGLGIGQYGHFWKDIYIRNIDYHPIDRFNEITNALNSTDYMRPYSVIFGIGADLGLLGMAVLLFFFIQLLRPLRTPFKFAICLAGILILFGAYAIVTPYVWLAFALMWGLATNTASNQNSSSSARTKKRILLLGINFAPEITGIGKYTGEMAAYLAGSEYEVRVVTGPPYYPYWKVQEGYRNRWYSQETWQNVRVIRCPLWVPHKPSGFTRLLHLLSFAASSLPAMLAQIGWQPHLVMVVVPAIFAAPNAWLTARLSGAKCWIHIQDFELDAALHLGMLPGTRWGARLVQWLEKHFLGWFDQLSTISFKMEQRLWEKKIPKEKTTLIKNWVDMDYICPVDGTNPYRQEWGIHPGEVIVLYSGNIGRKQGLDTLAETAKIVRDHKSIRFIIAGEGAARSELEESVKELENTRLLPLQPYERLNDLLNAADIHVLVQKTGAEDLVMPSKLSGMLASGRSVIVTANPQTELGQVAMQTALLVPPEDPLALAQAVIRLADSDTLRSELGGKGRQYAVEHFSKSRILASLASTITELAMSSPTHSKQ